VKPPLRTKSVGTKVSEAEFALLEERARVAGLTLSEWVREALLAGPVEVETGEIVLAEVLALRSLFLNLQFRADKGPLTETELRGLIERADGVKMQRARERLEAVRAADRAAAEAAEPVSAAQAEEV
jgi:Mobilization protein NikA